MHRVDLIRNWYGSVLVLHWNEKQNSTDIHHPTTTSYCTSSAVSRALLHLVPGTSYCTWSLYVAVRPPR